MTPVIIKSGGGVDFEALKQTTEDPNLVTIDSPSMAFSETVEGRRWESSQSTKTGRIVGLTITDGSEPSIGQTIDQTNELVSIIINYGSDQITVMESGVPAKKEVFLLITSPGVPFDVPQSGNWNAAHTTFQSPITSVTLMVGSEEKFTHAFSSTDVKLQIDFDQNPPN
jgi:hypothetical protein